MRKTRFFSLKWLFDQKLLFQRKKASVPNENKYYNKILLVEKQKKKVGLISNKTGSKSFVATFGKKGKYMSFKY